MYACNVCRKQPQILQSTFAMKFKGTILTLLSVTFGINASDVTVGLFVRKQGLMSKISDIDAESITECAVSCNLLASEGCNGIKYDKKTGVCTRGSVSASIEEHSGLKVAWASSSQVSASFAIDGVTEASYANKNIFQTLENKEKFPWLAIDMIAAKEVHEVSMVNRNDCCAERTVDIEVRVGNIRPFEANTEGDSLIQTGAVCGIFNGPALVGSVSQVKCTSTLVGRYISLQVGTHKILLLINH